MKNLLKEQILIYESNISLILIGNLIAASLLIFLLQPIENDRNAVLWLGSQIGFNLIRYFTSLRIKAIQMYTDFLISKRYLHYITMAIISGILWGISPFLLFPIDSIEQQLLFVLVISVFTATAINLVNTLPKAYNTMMFMVYVPLISVLLLEKNQYSSSLGIVMIVFVLFMIITARAYRKSMMESIRLRIELEHINSHDPLTGLANEDYFKQQLQQECKRAMRHLHSLSIIKLAIDSSDADTISKSLKNDRMQKVAYLLKENIGRSGEIVAYSGDHKFIILLPCSKPAAAIKLAEKIHQLFTLTYAINDKQNSLYDVSLHMGIASATPNTAIESEHLMQQANQALNEALTNKSNFYQKIEN